MKILPITYQDLIKIFPTYKMRQDLRTEQPGRLKSLNVLLVYPHFPLTYWGFQYSLAIVDKKATLPPLGLLTLAGLLPENWNLRLVDLNVEKLDNKDIQWADVLLTGGMLIQVESMHEIISRAHSFDVPVVVGGPAPTTSPMLFDDADVVFRGEAEGRIRELVAAITEPSSAHLILNAPTDFPDIKSVAVPRFDLIQTSRYASMCIQYSRGCPFQCEFCDIVEIFGRSPRVKTTEQVIADLDAIYALGYRGTLFFVDDNFIGNKTAVKQLLPVIQEWQKAHGRPFEFYTEASLDLASDPKLLSDMVAASFTSVFVGIETPSKKALEQTKKFQNLRLDLSEAIHRITAAGLEIMGGFIVGFDSDGLDTFALQREFLKSQPIPLAMMGILIALPGTALWRRLELEGRLRNRPNGDPFTRPNFVPVMNEIELLRAYSELLGWLYSPDVYYERCRNFLDQVGPLAKTRIPSRDEMSVFLRIIWRVGIVGPNRGNFWRLIGKAIARGLGRLRQSVAHAVQGEHMIRYTREHVLPLMESAIAQAQIEIEDAALAKRIPQRIRLEARPDAYSGAVFAGRKTRRTELRAFRRS